MTCELSSFPRAYDTTILLSVSRMHMWCIICYQRRAFYKCDLGQVYDSRESVFGY